MAFLKLEKALDVEKKILMNTNHLSLITIIESNKKKYIEYIEKNFNKILDSNLKLRIKEILERIIRKNKENLLIVDMIKKEVYKKICKMENVAKFL